MSPKRIKKIFLNPNPLFCKWIEEWKKEAKDKNSPMQHVYGKALKSLKKYPLPLETGQHCKILENFGDQICKRLDVRLEQHSKNSILSCSDPPAQKRKTSSNVNAQPKKKRNEYMPAYRSGAYAILRSLLEITESKEFKGFAVKNELQDIAQQYCDVSFSHSDNGSHYTAWSSMGTLVKKDLIKKWSCPAKYALTEKGIDLAKKLTDVNTSTTSNVSTYNSKQSEASKICCDSTTDVTVPLKDLNVMDSFTALNSHLKRSMSPLNKPPSTGFQYIDSNGQQVETKDKSHVEILDDFVGFLALVPSSWALYTKLRFRFCQSRETDDPEFSYVLIKDDDAPTLCPGLDSNIKFRDHSGSQKKAIVEETQIKIHSSSRNEFEIILCIDCNEMHGNDNLTKQLDLKNVRYHVRKLHVGDFIWIAQSKNDPSQEFVLPYVVERKRSDDLCGSIKDGRFREQKFRLKQCGINNCIYLIEKFDVLTLPESTVSQAIVNTQVVDEFIVQFCQNKYETYKFLAKLTFFLEKKYMMFDCATLLPFQEFNQDSKKIKNWSVKDMFAKHLMQCNSLTADKAKAIISSHPTPRHLREHLLQESKQGEVIANIKYNTGSKKIGNLISVTINKLYTEKNLE